MAYRRSYGTRRSTARRTSYGRRSPQRRTASRRRSTGSRGGTVRLVIETAHPTAVSRPDLAKVGLVEKRTGRAKF